MIRHLHTTPAEQLRASGPGSFPQQPYPEGALDQLQLSDPGVQEVVSSRQSWRAAGLLALAAAGLAGCGPDSLPAIDPPSSVTETSDVETSLIQERSSYKSGVAGVYNPVTGQVEWKESYKSGVAGVWNPGAGKVEWKESYKSGVAGVWNPVQGQVEWRESYKSGVAGVWNTVTGQVEWKESYKSGVAGVWNPVTARAEWKESYKSGVAGIWNAQAGKVEWRESYKSGVALVSADPGNPTSASSSGWYLSFDDDD